MGAGPGGRKKARSLLDTARSIANDNVFILFFAPWDKDKLEPSFIDEYIALFAQC